MRNQQKIAQCNRRVRAFQKMMEWIEQCGEKSYPCSTVEDTAVYEEVLEYIEKQKQKAEDNLEFAKTGVMTFREDA